MGNKLQNRAGTTSPMFVFGWEDVDLAITQTDTDIPILGGLTFTYVMPFDGSIVGYGIKLSTAVTAGSLEFDFEINGASTKTVETDAASTTEFFAKIDFEIEPFLAGDLLGVTFTSTSGLLPTTADVNVMLYVMFTDFDI